MVQGRIELRGTYSYPDRIRLERALAAARRCMAEDDHVDTSPDWTRSFVARGTTLHVDAVLPLSADPYLAASVLDVLAHDATEGVVETLHDGSCVDLLPCGESDGD